MRILHVADTHLGTRQYGLEARRQDFAAAFVQVVDLALEHGVRAVVHAGDLFNDRTPLMEDLSDVVRQLGRLREAGVSFLGVVGNHEGKRGLQWLDLFQHLGLAVHLGPEAPFELEGVPVWGMDFAGRRQGGVVPPRAGDGVLVMHQMLDQSSPGGELKLEDLFASGARCVLLGDYHEHKVWRDRGAIVSYSGSSERWSAAERARRGCTIFDLDSGSLQRLELETRRFVYLEDGQDPLQELEAYANRLAGAVVVIRLAGFNYTPRQLEAEGQRHGALHVVVHRAQREVADWDPLLSAEQLSSVEQVEAVVSQAVERADFSELTRRVDQIIRDPHLPDSRVEGRVEELWAEAGL